MQGNSFNYKYLAPTEKERREIESIRRQYISDGSEKNKLLRLKNLHSAVRKTAAVWSITLGTVGTLIFGSGLSLILEINILPLGIALSVLGALTASAAYPVYKLIFNSKKKKHSEEIIRLSDELLG